MTFANHPGSQEARLLMPFLFNMASFLLMSTGDATLTFSPSELRWQRDEFSTRATGTSFWTHREPPQRRNLRESRALPADNCMLPITRSVTPVQVARMLLNAGCDHKPRLAVATPSPDSTKSAQLTSVTPPFLAACLIAATRFCKWGEEVISSLAQTCGTAASHFGHFHHSAPLQERGQHRFKTKDRARNVKTILWCRPLIRHIMIVKTTTHSRSPGCKFRVGGALWWKTLAATTRPRNEDKADGSYSALKRSHKGERL